MVLSLYLLSPSPRMAASIALVYSRSIWPYPCLLAKWQWQTVSISVRQNDNPKAQGSWTILELVIASSKCHGVKPHLCSCEKGYGQKGHEYMYVVHAYHPGPIRITTQKQRSRQSMMKTRQSASSLQSRHKKHVPLHQFMVMMLLTHAAKCRRRVSLSVRPLQPS